MTDPATPEPAQRTLFSVQRLRALAAVSVVFSHASNQLGEPDLGFDPRVGHFGVDLFFVISGFIMVYITAFRPLTGRAFLTERIARIAPNYWFWTLVTAALALVLPQVFRNTEFAPLHLLLSLLFLAHENPAIAGSTSPLLRLGWTLNYEMLFYTLFALAIAVSSARRVTLAGAAIVALVAAGFVFRDAGPVAAFYTRSIMLEFLAGMVLGVLFVRRARFPDLPPWLIALLAGVLTIYVAVTVTTVVEGYWRGFAWALPATGVMALALGKERAPGGAADRAVLAVGDASYTLYLMHLFPLSLLRLVWKRVGLPVEGAAATWMFVAVAIPLCIVCALIAYRLFEKPLTALIRGRMMHRTRSAAS